MQSSDERDPKAGEVAEPAPAHVSTFVLDGLEPLRLVVHHEDESWEFLCGTTTTADHLLLMHSGHMFRRFGFDLFHLRELPRGHIAEREGAGQDWQISRYEDFSEDEALTLSPGGDGQPADVAVSVWVLEGREPVRMVIHHSAGDWTVVCGTVDSTDQLRGMPLSWLRERPDMSQLVDQLPPGRMVTRDHPQEPWVEEDAPD